jgi:hypothetical protein
MSTTTQQTRTIKQAYAQPKLTDHGDAVKATTGLVGRCWELLGTNHGDIRVGDA